jgi:transcription elongation factor SPT5
MADYDREGSAESEVFNPVAEIDEDDETTSQPAPRRPAADDEDDEDEDDGLGLTGNPDEDEEGAGVDLDNDDDEDDDEEDDDEDDVVVRGPGMPGMKCAMLTCVGSTRQTTKEGEAQHVH